MNDWRNVFSLWYPNGSGNPNDDVVAVVLSRDIFAGTMPSMQPQERDGVDWTGVQPDTSPIGPLDSRSFPVRLQRLGERARSLTVLREAFI